MTLKCISISSQTVRKLALKILGVYPLAIANKKQEIKQLLADVIANLKVFIRAEKPKIATKIIQMDVNSVKTLFLDEYFPKEKTQTKQTIRFEGNRHKAFERTEFLLSLIETILDDIPDTIASLDLNEMTNFLLKTLNEHKVKLGSEEEFVNGLSISDYNMFLNATKLKIFHLLSLLVSKYGSSMYSFLGKILKETRKIFLNADN